MPYLYCEHDPINAVDPSGHDAGTAEGWFAVAAATLEIPGVGEVIGAIAVGVLIGETIVTVVDRYGEHTKRRPCTTEKHED